MALVSMLILITVFHIYVGKSGKHGIIIYVSNLLASSQKFEPNSTFEEQLWIRFDFSRSHVLLVGCIYRSPSNY